MDGCLNLIPSNSKLFLNRLKTPRVKIPPGSVGIVEKFCNIYPYEIHESKREYIQEKMIHINSE